MTTSHSYLRGVVSAAVVVAIFLLAADAMLGNTRGLVVVVIAAAVGNDLTTGVRSQRAM